LTQVDDWHWEFLIFFTQTQIFTFFFVFFFLIL